MEPVRPVSGDASNDAVELRSPVEPTRRVRPTNWEIRPSGLHAIRVEMGTLDRMRERRLLKSEFNRAVAVHPATISLSSGEPSRMMVSVSGVTVGWVSTEPLEPAAAWVQARLFAWPQSRAMTTVMVSNLCHESDEQLCVWVDLGECGFDVAGAPVLTGY